MKEGEIENFKEIKEWKKSFLRSMGLSEDDVVWHYEYHDGSVYINALDKDGNSIYRENGSLDPCCRFVIGCEGKWGKQMKKEEKISMNNFLEGVVNAAWFCFVALLILTDVNVNWWIVCAVSVVLFVLLVLRLWNLWGNVACLMAKGKGRRKLR